MGIDENNNPVMSEISRYAGVHATDSEWSTMFLDMNNDGKEDLFVTNGMKRDVNDKTTSIIKQRPLLFVRPIIYKSQTTQVYRLTTLHF